MSFRLLTHSQMLDVDGRSVDLLGSDLPLMERAGQGLLQSLQSRGFVPSDKASPNLWILCGKGKNGGDGLVLARLLQVSGWPATTFLAEPSSSLSIAAAHQYGLAVTAGAKVLEGTTPDFALLTGDDVVVDALLGTGFQPPLRAPYTQWIEALLGCSAQVLAVDIPSGLAADSPNFTVPVVQASWTATMAFPKRSMMFSPAREKVGQLDVVDIGVPPEVFAEMPFAAEVLSPASAGSLLPSSEGRDHKGRWGGLLVAGGSPGLSGAPILAAKAALRCGIGMLRVATPKSQTQIVDGHLLEAMTTALPEGEDGQVLARGAEQILAKLGAWDVLALGPGLGRFPEVDRFVLKLVGGWRGPLVVDADALNVLAAWGTDSWVPRVRDVRAKDRPGGCVLTPHPGELSRLTGRTVQELQATPIETAREWASRWGVTLVAKGAPSVIAAPDGRVWVNPTGHHGLSTGGSGDVLTGMIGALLAQGMEGPEAAVLGCYLHGAAADLWGRAATTGRSARGLLPTDVIQRIPEAIACIETGRDVSASRWRRL